MMAAAVYFVDPRLEEVFRDMTELTARKMAERIASLVRRVTTGEGYATRKLEGAQNPSQGEELSIILSWPNARHIPGGWWRGVCVWRRGRDLNPRVRCGHRLSRPAP